LGERRENTKAAVKLAEGERERRIAEGASSELEAIAAKITAKDLAMQAAENERLRRMSLLEGLIEQKERELIHEQLRVATEQERVRRMSEGFEYESLIDPINQSIRRRSSLRTALSTADTEKARRMYGHIAEDAAVAAQRKMDLALVKAAEEQERARRIGEEVFADASSKAIREISRRLSIELEDTEKARRIAVAMTSQSAARAEAERAAYLADVAYEFELNDQIDEDAKTEARESLLYSTTIDEFARNMEERERMLNREYAIELMELEKIRRITVEEAHQAQEDHERRMNQNLAVKAANEEKAYRIGQENAVRAAEMAESKLNRKLSAELEAQEKLERSVGIPLGISA